MMKKHSLKIAVIMILFFSSFCFGESGEDKEKGLLPLHKDKVERKGDSLLLKVHGKVFKTLKDSPPMKDTPIQEQGKNIYYRFIDVDVKTHTLLIEIQLYEGLAYYLFDYHVGSEVQINGKPVWSPEGDHFIAFGYPWLVCSIGIWDFDKRGFKKGWEQTLCALDMQWSTNNQVCVTWHEGGLDDFPNTVKEKKYMNCNHNSGKWDCVETKVCLK